MRHNPAAESRLQRSAAQLPPTMVGLWEDTDTQRKGEETLHQKKAEKFIKSKSSNCFLFFPLALLQDNLWDSF